jgi:diacylglycerol kinase family enzyme
VAPVLFVNPRSGDDTPSADELASEARARGVEVHVLHEGEDVEELARGADADALGMAGGDGSLAPVATVAIERSLPFVCVPFGTRNHFARDLGLDRDDPAAALDAFVDGRERRVDVGRCGGRVFLNNVSLGDYAQLVHEREEHRRRREALARARAWLILLRDRGHPPVFSIDGEAVEARIVLIGNNRYSLDVLSLGERDRLDEGCLHVYVARGLTPGTWEERTAARVTVDTPSQHARAAVDGEPAELDTPLEFRVEPQSLRVLLPPRVEHPGHVRERERVRGR